MPADFHAVSVYVLLWKSLNCVYSYMFDSLVKGNGP